MEQLLDKFGRTEEEFLREYDPSKFERPSVTVDIFLFCKKTNSVLLIKRGGHPSIGKWALPGGFLEMNETAEEGAKRELFEETNVKIESLRQVRVFSEPKRDPRTRIVTVAFLAVTDEEVSKYGDDAADDAWFKIRKTVLKTEKGIENGIIKLESNKEVMQYFYKKTLPTDGISLPMYSFSGANRLAGDHAEIIACLINETEELLCLKLN